MTAPTTPRLVTPGLPELIAKQRKQREAEEVLRKAMKATHSESDRRAYAMDLFLVAHPEVCHTAKDYPGWVPGCPACPPNDNAPEVTA
jgi:hypothetical protein